MLTKLTLWFQPSASQKAVDTARLTAENERLKQEVQRQANIINCSLNPIWQRDTTLNITYCNLAFSEIAEETADQVVAIGDMELYKGHRQLAAKALETGREQIERHHVIVNGERRLYLIREVPFAKEGMVIGYAKDISELESAHEEIQRHVSALRDLLESSTSAMAIYGRDQKLKFYNFAFVALWKIDEAFLDSEPTYGQVLEHMREKRKLPEQSNFKAFKEQQLKQFTALIEPSEEFFYLPDGKTLRVVAIPHALGGILFAYEDVTDRLALERSYNTLIAVQRETLDNLHEGIVVFGENGRLTLSNPTFAKLWHLEPEFAQSEPHIREVLNLCKPMFAVPDWPAYLEELVARFQQRKFFQTRFERSDGSVMDCSCVPLPDGATLLSFTDMTASTLVERSLRERAAALEEADRLKTEFLANMSYELRSPLTSISGFSEMLTKEYMGALNEAQKEYVGGIYQSAQQLAALISDIIDLATIQAGFMELDAKHFAVRPLIDSAVAMFAERTKSGACSIEVEIADGLTVMCGDETRLRQLLVNLISNALASTKNRGRIVIRAHQEHTATTSDVVLTVSDDGPAISPERQAKLFEPFFKGVLKRGADATLGLSVVKRLVELHRGSIRVESGEATGTRIICVFPQ